MRDVFLEEFARTAVHSADQNSALLDAPPNDPRIAALVARNDYVTALWLEGTVIQMMGVKEDNSGKDYIRCTTIPRRDKQAAQALQDAYQRQQ